jgi:hypothetical protein
MKTAAMKKKWQRRIGSGNSGKIWRGGENNRKRNGMAAKKPGASMKANEICGVKMAKYGRKKIAAKRENEERKRKREKRQRRVSVSCMKAAAAMAK